MTWFSHRWMWLFMVALMHPAELARAQSVASWRVVESSALGEQPMPGVTVQAGCGEDGGPASQVWATDLEGRVPDAAIDLGCEEACWATFSFVGYESQTSVVKSFPKRAGWSEWFLKPRPSTRWW